MRRIATGLALAALPLLGCKQGTASAGPDGVQADRAAPDPVHTCTQSCARFQVCEAELAATAEPELEDSSVPAATGALALAAAFPYGCGDGCATPREEIDSAIQADCVALQTCGAFYTCATGSSATTILAAADTSTVDCEQACSWVAACSQDQEGKQACMKRCTALEADDPARSELAACPRACGELEPCYEAWLTGSPSGLTRPPGVSETCDKMCIRGIQCGAEDEELSAAELADVASTMTDTYVECAVQCEADMRDDTRTAYQSCVEQEDCEAFRACAEEL